MGVERQYRYRDPAEVIEYEESRTCKGCIHKNKAWGVEVCGHPSRNGGKAVRRCKHYDDKRGG